MHAGVMAVPHIVPLPVGAGAPPAPCANALLLRVDVPAKLWRQGLLHCLLLGTETDFGMLLLHGCGCGAAPRLILVSICQEANPLFARVVVCEAHPTRATFSARPSLLL